MALLTDSELPQVEKNACSASTASAINCWACSMTPLRVSRSSRPFTEITSEANTASPTISSTRGSTPRP
jgi:hypothetical protein